MPTTKLSPGETARAAARAASDADLIESLRALADIPDHKFAGSGRDMVALRFARAALLHEAADRLERRTPTE